MSDVAIFTTRHGNPPNYIEMRDHGDGQLSVEGLGSGDSKRVLDGADVEGLCQALDEWLATDYRIVGRVIFTSKLTYDYPYRWAEVQELDSNVLEVTAREWCGGDQPIDVAKGQLALSEAVELHAALDRWIEERGKG
jgi:hypothetical protein